MGITIDEHLLYEMGYNTGFKDGIKGSILKADYETRLKADMVDILDKIRAEIERQEKWLMDAGYNQYNVDIALNAIKLEVDKYKAEQKDT